MTIDEMTNSEIDEMNMSTFETFDVPQLVEYDRENMMALDNIEEGRLNVKNTLVNASLWNHPHFNDVSKLMNIPSIDGHVYQNKRGDAKELYVGQKFPSKESVIVASKRFSVKNRVEFYPKKSDTGRLVLKCRTDKDICKWHLRAVKKLNASEWEITKFEGLHTCQIAFISPGNVHFNKDLIARDLMDLLKEKLKFPPNEVKEMMRSKYGFDITYIKAWKARRKAIEYLYGDWEKSFERLPAYIDMLVELNPGSVVFWKKSVVNDQTRSIDRVFWAFSPAIEAFAHCRPVISIDGTHLYGKYTGVLMIAIGIDANNQLLPLAYALVESENNDSWRWFMSCIRVGVTQREQLCVISDRHNGILNVMKEDEWAPPKAYHRICVRHLAINFNRKLNNQTLRESLKKMAYETQERKFFTLFRDLKEKLKDNVHLLKWLDDLPLELWTLSFDKEGRRWGALTTNGSECYNHILLAGRDLPITALVHFTFKQANEYFTAHRDRYENYTKLYTPNIEKKISENIRKACGHVVEVYDQSDGVATVMTGSSQHIHTVSMNARTCTCGKWQAYHFPCSHVLAGCKKERITINTCVSPKYSIQAYIDTWAPIFHPLPDMADWKEYSGLKHVHAPHFKTAKKGRCASKRRHNEMDKPNSKITQSVGIYVPKRVSKCSICGEVGHNKKTCTLRVGVPHQESGDAQNSPFVFVVEIFGV